MGKQSRSSAGRTARQPAAIAAHAASADNVPLNLSGTIRIRWLEFFGGILKTAFYPGLRKDKQYRSPPAMFLTLTSSIPAGSKSTGAVIACARSP
jgi:hypothetical protein